MLLVLLVCFKKNQNVITYPELSVPTSVAWDNNKPKTNSYLDNCLSILHFCFDYILVSDAQFHKPVNSQYIK